MNNPEFYKPSNIFSPVGLVLMFASMVAVGVLVSWLYLVLNAVIPLIYLNILLAVGVSAAIGFIGSQFVKIFKIRSPMAAIIVTVVALLFVNYAKWAIYVGRDNQKYIYDEFEGHTITETGYAFFAWGLAGGGEKATEETVDEVYNTEEDGYKVYQDPINKLSDYAKQQGSVVDLTDMSDYERALYDNGASIWEILFLDSFFGTNVEDITESANNMMGNGDMDAEEWLDKYGHKKNAMFYITHPGKLFRDIKIINAVGRWSIKSSRYSVSESNSSLVKGWMLWIVWLGELVILAAPAIMIIQSRAKEPFIESEDEWAIVDKPAPDFKFIDPYPTQTNSPSLSAGSFKKDPDYLFTLEPLTALMAVPDRYFFLTYCRSKYYDEIYATLNCSTLTNKAKNQRQNQVLVKNMRVDADFLATMFGRFHYQVPPLCQGENRAEAVEKESKEREKQQTSGKPLAPQRPKATGAEAIFDEPPITAKPKPKVSEEDFAKQQLEEERRQAEAEHKMQAVEVPKAPPKAPEKPPVQSYTPPPGTPGGSGLMDGIDTSNLDLDNFDFK